MKIIKLTQGYEALVSDEDYEEINRYRWRVDKRKNTNYAVRTFRKENGKPKYTSMHIQIAKTPKGMQTDHIDGNGLNNTRENLRIVTHRQNGQNRHCSKTSIYPGVSWYTPRGTWKAQININGKIKEIGQFKDERKAYQAYLKALSKINEVIVSDLAPISASEERRVKCE